MCYEFRRHLYPGNMQFYMIHIDTSMSNIKYISRQSSRRDKYMFKEWKHSEFQLEDEWYYIPMLLWNFFKYILNTNNRRDVALPTRTIVSRRPTRPASPLFFLSCFLLYNLSGVRRFLLLFTFLWSRILKIWPFSLHSRVLFSVCVWGGGM